MGAIRRPSRSTARIAGAAKTVLSDPGDVGPDNVAFDTNGHVYVSNSFANSGGPGNILQYTGTSMTKRCRIPTSPRRKALPSITATTFGFRTGILVAPAPTSQSSRRGNMPAKLFKNISLGFPGSLQFDRKQNLLAVDDNFRPWTSMLRRTPRAHDNSTYLGER